MYKLATCSNKYHLTDMKPDNQPACLYGTTNFLKLENLEDITVANT